MLHALSLAVSALFSPPSSPPIVCEISMEEWCIVQLPSTIEMHQTGRTREWTITTNADTARAQVRISENKFCDGELSFQGDAGLSAYRFEALREHCGLTVVVSGQDPNVRPKTVVEMLIMLKRGGQWQTVRF
jgi:hypothetical protein